MKFTIFQESRIGKRKGNQDRTAYCYSRDALFMVVAWRIAHLMRTGRTCPDLDATLFFDPDEIQGAYLLTKKKPPNRPPRLNEVLRLIATLGGFLARKGDGEPGVKTIWLGLQRVMDAATTIQVLRNPAAMGCV